MAHSACGRERDQRKKQVNLSETAEPSQEEQDTTEGPEALKAYCIMQIPEPKKGSVSEVVEKREP